MKKKMSPRQKAATQILDKDLHDEKIRRDQLRRGKIGDKRHEELDELDLGMYDPRRRKLLDRANAPTIDMQLLREKTPVTSSKEGFIFDHKTSVYQGDGPFVPNFQRQVLDQRETASDKDAAAFARANAGLDPIVWNVEARDRHYSPYRSYPGAPLKEYEKAKLAGGQSEWGTRAELKK